MADASWNSFTPLHPNIAHEPFIIVDSSFFLFLFFILSRFFLLPFLFLFYLLLFLFRQSRSRFRSSLRSLLSDSFFFGGFFLRGSLLSRDTQISLSFRRKFLAETIGGELLRLDFYFTIRLTSRETFSMRIMLVQFLSTRRDVFALEVSL